jgi:hypothetical protein
MKDDWNIIHTYSRADAVRDGVQILLDKTLCSEASIVYPVYCTERVFNRYIKVPEKFIGTLDETGRTWDILTLFVYHLKKHVAKHPNVPKFLFYLYVALPDDYHFLPNEKQSDNFEKHRLVTLEAECGPQDFDDPTPVITLMIPGED